MFTAPATCQPRYWVMYEELVRLSRSDEPPNWVERKVQHFGTDSLTVAEKSVARLNDDAARKEHFISHKPAGFRILRAWVEVEYRFPLERNSYTDLSKLQEEAMGPRPEAECKASIFRHHNCSRCSSGAKPCVEGNYDNCSYPIARND